LIRTIRKILFPFSLIYDLITSVRNFLYDKGLIHSYGFELPIIAIGNLNVGGTGKSPQVEYLIRILSPHLKLAVLSRGYGRKTKGFVLADSESRAGDVGDEPLQFYKKFSGITVAVDENRARGIQRLLQLIPDLELILLDDAFQHRKVRAGYYILLTSFSDLYSDDLLLPAGNLRESKRQARRADTVVVTKCPEELNIETRAEIQARLSLEKSQKLFFSEISYADKVIGPSSDIDVDQLNLYQVILVTGIANPNPLLEFLRSKNVEFHHLKFGDHHKFSENDIQKIVFRFEKMQASKKIILTTEKDYVRNFLDVSQEVYYLPIETKFLDGHTEFDEIINSYVRKN